MKRVINGKLYYTETAEDIANNEFADGSNRMTCGRCATLYKTKKGNYFVHHETCWEGEHNTIEPLSKNEAKEVFEDMPNQSTEWEDAFDEAAEEA